MNPNGPDTDKNIGPKKTETPFYKSWNFWSAFLRGVAIAGAGLGAGYAIARITDRDGEDGHVTEM